MRPLPSSTRNSFPSLNILQRRGSPKGAVQLAFDELLDLGHVHLEASAHSGGNGHGEHVLALSSRGLQALHSFKESLEVAQDLLGAEGDLAERSTTTATALATSCGVSMPTG